MKKLKKMSSREKIQKSLFLLLVSVAAIMFVAPIIIIILNTFKTTTELYSSELNILPKHWQIGNYVTALMGDNYIAYMFNSFFVAIAATILTVSISTMAGYGFSHYDYRASKWCLVIIMSTVMIPLEVIMLPVFQMVKHTGLYNSLWGIIIPVAATPTGIIIMRQNMLSIPKSLIEAARVEGLSEWLIFLKIIVPLSKTSMSTLAIFSFMWRWNDYIYPLIVISDPKKYTLQQAIANFAGEYSVNWSGLLSISALAMIPVVIVFIIFQQQFIEGIAQSGSKE